MDSLLPNPVMEMMDISNLLADGRNHVFCAEILEAERGEELAQRVVALVVDILDAEPFLVAERVEVLEGEHADVRRVVPLVRQFLGLGHATMDHEASAGRPVSKIRERDDGLLGNAQEFVQERHGVADFLDGAVNNRVVETSVLQVRNPALVQVALDNLHVLLDAVQNAGDALLDAETGRLLLVGEVVEQVATAATEVEYVAAFLHELAEQLEVALLVEHGYGLRSLLRDNLRIQEAPHSLAEFAHLDKESVVAELRVEFEASDRLAHVQKRARDAAALVRREQPVGREVHVQHFGADILEGVLDAAVFRFQVECVGRVRDMQVAVRVKAVYELCSLVAQVAFDRQVQVERRGVSDGVVLVLLRLCALELLFHADSRKVRDVRKLAGVGKAHVGLCDAFAVEVAVVVVRILRNHVAGHHFETERLAREARGTCDNHDALDLRGVVDCPLHRLKAAHRAAQDAVEFLDAETVGEFLLCVHHVADGDGGEGTPVGLARARVHARGAGSALAAAQDVAADHEEAVRVDGFAGSDEFVPPAGLLVVFGVPAGGMRVGGERRADPHRIVGSGIQRAVSLVTDGKRRQRLTVFQHKTGLAIVLDEVLRLHGADAGFMQIFTHMHKYSKTLVPKGLFWVPGYAPREQKRSFFYIFLLMKNNVFFVLALCLTLVSGVFAKHVAVLETGADEAAKSSVSLSDRQYLTNVLREEAVKQLPAVQNYTIMTRENINAMLPPGKSLEECEGNCLAETGRNISADYICQARIGSFGGALTLSAELYETAGNKLMASFNGRGSNVEELLELIKQKAPEFFRSIKGNSAGASGVSGVNEIGGSDDFSFSGKKKFIVELASSPAGALPTIDGKGIPKCTSTPCKVQVEEGNHRIVMTLDRYDDAEMVVDVKENNQKIKLDLSPNFGYLVVKPVLPGVAANKGKLNIVVDGERVENEKVQLDPGAHSVQVSHPCYDPVEYKVTIAKNKTETIDKQMVRGKGGLELNAEHNGEPQAVAVFIDGLEAGSTPYVGEVPLCAEVTLRGKDWIEKVDVTPKWHEVVQVTHSLKHTPEAVAMNVDLTRAKAENAYAELDGKEQVNLREDALADMEGEKHSKAHWIVLGASTAVAATGIVLAVIGNNKAKDVHEEGFRTLEDYESNRDSARNWQTFRAVGIGIAIAGFVGIGVSFSF